MPSASWNSLEVAKLVVAAMTPIAVALLGLLIARSARRGEAAEWRNQKLVEQRITLLDKALPRLNDLYCYFLWVGDWKALSPVDVLRRKRELDRLFFAYAAYFSEPTLDAYRTYADTLFKTYEESGRDARLRTGISSHDGDRRSAFGSGWQESWTERFAEEEDRADRADVRRNYQSLTECLGREVGGHPRPRSRR